MRYTDLTPASTVLELAKRTFSPRDLMASTGLTENEITNYLTKADLKLCSVPEGRGKTRRFHLLDVYTLSLMSRLVKLTGSQQYAAIVSQYFLFLSYDPIGYHLSAGSTAALADTQRPKLASDICQARPAFWHRDQYNAPWFLMVEKAGIVDLDAEFHTICLDANCDLAEKTNLIGHMKSGYFINVSELFDGVDDRLLRLTAKGDA